MTCEFSPEALDGQAHSTSMPLRALCCPWLERRMSLTPTVNTPPHTGRKPIQWDSRLGGRHMRAGPLCGQRAWRPRSKKSETPNRGHGTAEGAVPVVGVEAKAQADATCVNLRLSRINIGDYALSQLRHQNRKSAGKRMERHVPCHKTVTNGSGVRNRQTELATPERALTSGRQEDGWQDARCLAVHRLGPLAGPSWSGQSGACL